MKTLEQSYSDSQWIKDESNSSFLFSLSEKQKFQLNKNKIAITRRKDKSAVVFYVTFRISDNSNNWKEADWQNNAFYLGRDYYNTSKYPYSK